VAGKAMADGSATRAVTQKRPGAAGKIATDGTDGSGDNLRSHFLIVSH
jgi:hypothetical protein